MRCSKTIRLYVDKPPLKLPKVILFHIVRVHGEKHPLFEHAAASYLQRDILEYGVDYCWSWLFKNKVIATVSAKLSGSALTISRDKVDYEM